MSIRYWVSTQQHCHKCHGNCGHSQRVKNKEVILLPMNELMQINTIPTHQQPEALDTEKSEFVIISSSSTEFQKVILKDKSDSSASAMDTKHLEQACFTRNFYILVLHGTKQHTNTSKSDVIVQNKIKSSRLHLTVWLYQPSIYCLHSSDEKKCSLLSNSWKPEKAILNRKHLQGKGINSRDWIHQTNWHHQIFHRILQIKAFLMVASDSFIQEYPCLCRKVQVHNWNT